MTIWYYNELGAFNGIYSYFTWPLGKCISFIRSFSIKKELKTDLEKIFSLPEFCIYLLYIIIYHYYYYYYYFIFIHYSFLYIIIYYYIFPYIFSYLCLLLLTHQFQTFGRRIPHGPAQLYIAAHRKSLWICFAWSNTKKV